MQKLIHPAIFVAIVIGTVSTVEAQNPPAPLTFRIAVPMSTETEQALTKAFRQAVKSAPTDARELPPIGIGEIALPREFAGSVVVVSERAPWNDKPQAGPADDNGRVEGSIGERIRTKTANGPVEAERQDLLSIDDLINSLTAMLEQNPDDKSARLLRGCLQGSVGRNDRLVADLDHLIEADGDNLDYHGIRAFGRDAADGIDDLTKYLAANEGNVLARLTRAKFYAREGKSELAAEDCKKCIQLDPTCLPAYELRVAALIKLSQLDEALANVEAGMRLSPDSTPLRAMRAFINQTNENWKPVVEDMTVLIETDPSCNNLINRGTAHSHLGQYQEAERDYTEAIQRDRNRADAWTTRGKLRTMIGGARLIDALADLDHAIGLNPSEESYLVRGVIRRNLGRHSKAIDDFAAAKAINPDSYFAHVELAWTWATCPEEAHRKGDLAIAAALRAAQIEPSHIRTHEVFAAVCAETGKFDEAVKIQEQIVKLKPDDETFQTTQQRRLDLYRVQRPYRETPTVIEEKADTSRIPRSEFVPIAEESEPVND